MRPITHAHEFHEIEVSDGLIQADLATEDHPHHGMAWEDFVAWRAQARDFARQEVLTDDDIEEIRVGVAALVGGSRFWSVFFIPPLDDPGDPECISGGSVGIQPLGKVPGGIAGYSVRRSGFHGGKVFVGMSVSADGSLVPSTHGPFDTIKDAMLWLRVSMMLGTGAELSLMKAAA